MFHQADDYWLKNQFPFCCEALVCRLSWVLLRLGDRGCEILSMHSSVAHCYIPFVHSDNIKLFLWRHRVPISFLTFMLSQSLSAFSMKSFSEAHKSHIFCPGLYFMHFFAISQCTVGVGFNPSFQTRDDSAVLDFFFTLEKLFLCSPYLVLNSPSVSP